MCRRPALERRTAAGSGGRRWRRRGWAVGCCRAGTAGSSYLLNVGMQRQGKQAKRWPHLRRSAKGLVPGRPATGWMCRRAITLRAKCTGGPRSSRPVPALEPMLRWCKGRRRWARSMFERACQHDGERCRRCGCGGPRGRVARLETGLSRTADLQGRDQQRVQRTCGPPPRPVGRASQP